MKYLFIYCICSFASHCCAQYFTPTQNYLFGYHTVFVESLKLISIDSNENYKLRRINRFKESTEWINVRKSGSKLFYNLNGNIDSSYKYLFDINAKLNDTLEVTGVLYDLYPFYFENSVNKNIQFDTSYFIIDSIRTRTFVDRNLKTMYMSHYTKTFDFNSLHIFVDSIGFIARHSFILQSNLFVPNSEYICSNDQLVYSSWDNIIDFYKFYSQPCNMDSFFFKNSSIKVPNVSLKNQGISTFPSPVSEKLTINYVSGIDWNVSIYNLMGELVIPNISSFGSNQIIMDKLDLTDGLYFLLISDVIKGEKFVLKIFVKH